MRVGVPKEPAPGERRVSLVPQSVAALRAWDWETAVETGAGAAAGFPDVDYQAAGAEIVDAVEDVEVLATVGPPNLDQLDTVGGGGAVAGFLEPFTNEPLMRALVDGRLSGLAVEAMPRSTLAQSMDALSSQANLAGYAAVLYAAQHSPKLLPMMVTAAGTIAPARIVILGVGVAGLQAIATAKRLGGVVLAYDIRTETKEQVESLGARFIEAPTAAADAAGYATEVDEAVREAQHAALAQAVAEADIVVTTAQIPGRPAPMLVTREMVESMRPGALIVDMAASTGGNVEVTRRDEIVDFAGVMVHGPTNLASAVPADASRMYSKNLQNLLDRLRTASSPEGWDLDDEIIGGCTVVYRGEVTNARTRELLEGDAE